VDSLTWFVFLFVSFWLISKLLFEVTKGLGRGNLKLRADGRGEARREMGRHWSLSVLYSHGRFVGKKFGKLLSYNRSLGILVKCPTQYKNFVFMYMKEIRR
jgi:hypothetical protein